MLYTRTIILPCILKSYLPITIYFFIMVACPGYILESTKWIDVNESKCKRQRTILLSYILNMSLVFIKDCFLCHVSWWTSGVGLQVLPFIDNRHLGIIPRFQWFPCWYCLLYNYLITIYSLDGQTVILRFSLICVVSSAFEIFILPDVQILVL